MFFFMVKIPLRHQLFIYLQVGKMRKKNILIIYAPRRHESEAFANLSDLLVLGCLFYIFSFVCFSFFLMIFSLMLLFRLEVVYWFIIVVVV